MRAGRYSARDVQYCFAVVDEACEGRIGINDVTPFCNRMVNCLSVARRSYVFVLMQIQYIFEHGCKAFENAKHKLASLKLIVRRNGL